MAFKFKSVKNDNFKFPSSKQQTAKEGEEILSGYVDGISAKRDEEFFMSEVRKLPNVLSSSFRMAVGAPKNLPGWLELDALIETFTGARAFEIDDMSFVHLGQRESAETKLKDIRRVDGLRKMGINVRTIEHIDAADLEDRDNTKTKIRELRI